MDDHPTPLVTLIPSVLAIGCDPDVLSAAGAIAVENGLVLRFTSLDNLRTDILRYRPLILLVGPEVYEFDPDGIEESARDVLAYVAIAGERRDAEVLMANILRRIRARARG